MKKDTDYYHNESSIPEYGQDFLYFQNLIGKEKMQSLLAYVDDDMAIHRDIRIHGKHTQGYIDDDGFVSLITEESRTDILYNTSHEWLYTLESETDQTISVRIFPVTDKEFPSFGYAYRGIHFPLFTFIAPLYDITFPVVQNNSEPFFYKGKRNNLDEYLRDREEIYKKYPETPRYPEPWNFPEKNSQALTDRTNEYRETIEEFLTLPRKLIFPPFEKKYMITQFDTHSYTKPYTSLLLEPDRYQDEPKKIFYTIVPYYETQLPIYAGENHIKVSYL